MSLPGDTASFLCRPLKREDGTWSVRMRYSQIGGWHVIDGTYTGKGDAWMYESGEPVPRDINRALVGLIKRYDSELKAGRAVTFGDNPMKVPYVPLNCMESVAFACSGAGMIVIAATNHFHFAWIAVPIFVGGVACLITGSYNAFLQATMVDDDAAGEGR